MNGLTKKQIGLFIAGILTSNVTFFIRHFLDVNDFVDGVLKGIGIGLMILVLVRVSRQKKLEQNSSQ
ncbi:MAG: hypothetical protein RIA63_05505 [Cyclobacteriaceae bacterium]